MPRLRLGMLRRCNRLGISRRAGGGLLLQKVELLIVLAREALRRAAAAQPCHLFLQRLKLRRAEPQLVTPPAERLLQRRLRRAEPCLCLGGRLLRAPRVVPRRRERGRSRVALRARLRRRLCLRDARRFLARRRLACVRRLLRCRRAVDLQPAVLDTRHGKLLLQPLQLGLHRHVLRPTAPARRLQRWR